MAFSDALALKVRQRAHFQCCMCKAVGVEIHHIIPQAENGPDTFENAAPLCPSCHEIYGANRTKRKLIREMRDHWYEVCTRRYGADEAALRGIQSALNGAASKSDVEDLKDELSRLFSGLTESIRTAIGQATQLPDAAKRLSINDLLVHVYSKDARCPTGQVELLCEPCFWPDDQTDLRGILKAFVRSFGERALRQLCSNVLASLNIEPSEWLAEADLLRALGLLHSHAVCMVLVDGGQLQAAVTTGGELAWRLPTR